jgi:hypothetical protein
MKLDCWHRAVDNKRQSARFIGRKVTLADRCPDRRDGKSDPSTKRSLPEVLVAVSTSRLSCKRAAKTHNIDAGLGFIWRISD